MHTCNISTTLVQTNNERRHLQDVLLNKLSTSSVPFSNNNAWYQGQQMAKNYPGWIFFLQSDQISRSTHLHPCSINKIQEIYHVVFCSINHLYMALMSFKYNIVYIYTFMLAWQHYIRVPHLVLTVLKFYFNCCIIHVATISYANQWT